jgi:hypothetical protein
MGWPVAASLDELLAGATQRRPLLTADSKSGAHFERVVIGGERYVVKHMHVDDDWIMRATGDLRCRPLVVWQSALLDRLPGCIDHGIVGAAVGEGRNGWGAALLMRDLSPWLVPEGDDPIPLDRHLRFLDHMAALHAAYWGWQDTIGLLPRLHRYLEFNPDGMALEGARNWPDAVPPLVVDGWTRLPSLAGAVGRQVADLARDPSALVESLADAPQTLVHGDWKLGNLGTLPDGTTVLLDWAVTGQGCPTSELAWYLAINAARLPHPKEDAIESYRQSLTVRGVDTAGWWDTALDLALLGGLVLFGWEKALAGPGPELSWWLERAEAGLRAL